MLVAVASLLASAAARGASQRRCAPASMGIINENSLAGKMWGPVLGLTDLAKSGLDEALKGLGGDEDDAPEAAAAAAVLLPPRGRRRPCPTWTRARRRASPFSDFLTMSRRSRRWTARSPTARHEAQRDPDPGDEGQVPEDERIVEVMLDEERADLSLLVEDLKAGASNRGRGCSASRRRRRCRSRTSRSSSCSSRRCASRPRGSPPARPRRDQRVDVGAAGRTAREASEEVEGKMRG